MTAEHPAVGHIEVHAEAGLRSYTLSYAARPWSLNRERAGHWSAHREKTREWREAFGWLAAANEVPRFQACEVEVHVQGRRPLPDTGACIGAAKAAIDGIVDAGRLSHDGPDVVRRLIFNAPVQSSLERLTVTVREVVRK